MLPVKINTSVGERIGSPIDDVSYTNSEAHEDNKQSAH